MEYIVINEFVSSFIHFKLGFPYGNTLPIKSSWEIMARFGAWSGGRTWGPSSC